MIYTLPKPDYGYDALEPYTDAKTMEIHHSGHNQVYVGNFNKAFWNIVNRAFAEELYLNAKH